MIEPDVQRHLDIGIWHTMLSTYHTMPNVHAFEQKNTSHSLPISVTGHRMTSRPKITNLPWF